MNFLASLNKRRVFTTIGVLCIAFLCGHVMETFGSNALTRIDNSKVRPLPADPAAAELQRPTVMPGRINTPVVERIEAVAEPDDAICTPQLKLAPAPGALIDVEFNGCEPNLEVTLHQMEMEATEATDASGRIAVRIPAFSSKARVSVSFSGGSLVGAIKVPEADVFQHVAIVWTGEQVLRMHAFEFGAKRNQFGHVWAGAPKTPQRAIRGNGGFLTRLGDGAGVSAEIYSFPASQSRDRGVVRLMVEADVTQANCGRQTNALALQSGPLGGIDTTEVALKMPQCDRVGQVVRLQNLFQDMRLAVR